MTPEEHYQEAERVLGLRIKNNLRRERVEISVEYNGFDANLIALAQVHATLALAEKRVTT